MSLFRNFFGGEQSADVKTIMTEGAFLVDVREPVEFANGSAPGAVNIPLGRIPAELDQFRGKDNIIVFCRTGNRSGQAKTLLELNGFRNVTNGGSLEVINLLINSMKKPV